MSRRDQALTAHLGSMALVAAAYVVASCSGRLPKLHCVQQSDCVAPQLCVAGTCETLADALDCPLPPSGAVLGELCGDCLNGVWTCDLDGWRCFGAYENECGGCTLPPGELGSSCGSCGGEWACERTTYVCDDDRNSCGGCGPLFPEGEQPGVACEVGDGTGVDGIRTCVGPFATECTSPTANPCGGSTELNGVPGLPCGACGHGRWTCDGPDTIQCCGGDTFDECAPVEETFDACGGCAELPDAHGLPCGACGQGAWELDCEVGTWRCLGDHRNDCGGCAELEHSPGQSCEPGAVWACGTPNSLLCLATTEDVCSAAGEENTCSPCGVGRAVCAGPSTSLCIRLAEANGCGACAALPEQLGAECTHGLWACGEESASGVECGPSDTVDACGYPTGSEVELLSPCGECDGRWACDDQGLICVIAAERQPRPMYRDSDGDGFGDENDPGQSLCGGTDGYSETADDCDDELRSVNPDAAELPGNARDDDCDPSTPDE